MTFNREKEPIKDKKIKKTIPSWATLSASQLARVQKNSQMTTTARPKMDAIVMEAIKVDNEKPHGVSCILFTVVPEYQRLNDNLHDVFKIFIWILCNLCGVVFQHFC